MPGAAVATARAMTSAAASNPLSSSTSTKYHRISSNCASLTPVISDVPRSRPGRSSVARMPAANDPSPRKPSLLRHVLTSKHTLMLTSSTSFGRDCLLAGGLRVEQQRDAGLAGPLDVLVASSAAIGPYSSWLNSSWHSVNRRTIGRMSGLVLAPSAACHLLGAEVGQPSLAPRDLRVELVQALDGGGDRVVLDALDVPGQPRPVGVEVAVVARTRTRPSRAADPARTRA